GKMVVVGSHYDTGALQTAMMVGRFNTNGSIDTTFGNAGFAEGLFGDGAFGYGVVALGDGHIVASGNFAHPAGGPGTIIARFNANGSLDTTFGTGGSSSTPNPQVDTGYGLALRPNGNFVVAGTTGTDEIVRAWTSTGA